jgi:transposase-like protein
MEAIREMVEQESEGSRSPAEGARRASEAGDRWPFDEPPDPEVEEKPKRRTFTNEYKRKIVAEAEACKEPGEIGALLRREGIYSSNLSKWRQQQRSGALNGLTPPKRGPQADPTVPFKKRVAALERENEKLRGELAKARTIIDVQKKVSCLLGTPTERKDEESS